MPGSIQSRTTRPNGSPSPSMFRRSSSASPSSADAAEAAGTFHDARNISRSSRLVSLSSTTSTGRARTPSGRGAARSPGSSAKPSVAVNVKVVPMPRVLSRARSPPIILASRRLMANPSPVPPNFLEVELSAWLNAWNSRPCCSGGMPMPVSRTLIANCTRSPVPASSRATFTATSPLAVNLNALPTRLVSTCRTRNASPTRWSGTSGCTTVISSTCFSTTFARNVSVTSSRTVRRLKGASSRSSFSASIFEKSRMSLMIASRLRAEPCATLTYCCCRGVSGVSRASPVMLMIAFIGVRISWLITARNALFAWLAASAAALASAISACAVPSASRPESSACATSPSSLRPPVSPVRAERSPAFIRRAVPSSARVSRRKKRSAAIHARPKHPRAPIEQDAEVAERATRRARRAAASVGMPIDKEPLGAACAGLDLRERVQPLDAVHAWAHRVPDSGRSSLSNSLRAGDAPPDHSSPSSERIRTVPCESMTSRTAPGGSFAPATKSVVQSSASTTHSTPRTRPVGTEQGAAHVEARSAGRSDPAIERSRRRTTWSRACARRTARSRTDTSPAKGSALLTTRPEASAIARLM